MALALSLSSAGRPVELPLGARTQRAQTDYRRPCPELLTGVRGKGQVGEVVEGNHEFTLG